MKRLLLALCLIALIGAPAVEAKKKKDKADEPESKFKSTTFSGLSLRLIGPALTSGRIGDIAVNPEDHSEWFVAVASGGVWRTRNAGTTFTPVFDSQGSYSIGCVTIDPNNPNVIWVGTGENNSQRSVGYGDGVYKSVDGGSSWTHMGLKDSQHIGKILVDPRDSNVVYVAAQGPLWNAGGDRGLYKTTDGGATWDKVLEISENTGVTDIVLDSRNPDVILAASYQRRRRVWTLINGGPEGGLHRSTDGGATWNKVKGMPGVDIGRIGLTQSPAQPDIYYAIVEAEGDKGGFFRSTDGGVSWKKRSSYMSSSPQYYNEIVADPEEPGRVYSLDTWMQVTDDGGKTFRRLGGNYRHVDDHALWIDPGDTRHMIVGCDGGIYETWDRGATWHYKPNLPVTQFYKIAVDNDAPFYNVYGGTQDNFTLGGPSRTASANGISNSDWFVTVGGDGFEAAVDPEDPDIVYSQWQYGNLVRYDRSSGELLDIKPQPEPGDDPLRWNWDSALLISPHKASRIYFAAQRVFQSENRGESWIPISDDLTRALDRNALEVMGRIQKVDAVSKNRSTSPYGNIVALSESPLEEGLLYAGTDDGLIQVREAGGGWRKVDGISGVPELSYVSDVEASAHDVDTVYAVFQNFKSGDFKPYLYRSRDRGKSWSSISSNLPERGSVYTIVEDHERPDLLFAGTEFGLFFSVDRGKRWTQLKGSFPTVAVRDLEIQRRESDLVVGTFGRGIYILDDYSPLRQVTSAMLDQEATLFEPRRAWMYVPSVPLGIGGKSFQGDSHYTVDNPFGATFTYYMADALQSREDKRKKAEKKAEEAGEVYSYPSWDDLRAEDREQHPVVYLTVRDEDGNVIRRIKGKTGAGFQRVTWDLRWPASDPVDLSGPGLFNPFASSAMGPLAVPGVYSVSLSKRVDGVTTDLGEPQTFRTEPLGTAKLAAKDRDALLAFQRKVARLQRAVLGANRVRGQMGTRIRHLNQAVLDTPGADMAMLDRLATLQKDLDALTVQMVGDRSLARRSVPTEPGILQRVSRIIGGQWTATSAPTGTNRDQYRFASEAFAPALAELKRLDGALSAVERELEGLGAPWTPGRIPTWQPE
ncbi:glycosyl hydrolase [Acidobacteria bacterium Mor1]|nr:glycosyl hydrolase [Acidobacteria bacterium Mor1]